MIGFVYQLSDAGIPVSVKQVLDLYRALQRGLAADLDQLFLLTRLIFVKKLEHYDRFHQVFAACFLGMMSNGKAIDWESLLLDKPFRQWLMDQVKKGQLSLDAIREMDTEELLERFWKTLLDQKGSHHGGNRWIGTGGRSPFGHSGHAGGGVRVYGESLHGTAQKVIGNRNFIRYSGTSRISSENLGQVLIALKSLRPVGAETELDVDESIAKTARNGGSIELVFRRELRNRIKLILLMDNGGFSMTPYVELIRTVFNKIRALFREVQCYYFHNCIYGVVYQDPARTKPVKWEKLLTEHDNARLLIFGDANMAPSELMAAYGSIDMYSQYGSRKPGLEWLKELHAAFPASVWLNPIAKRYWKHESITIERIGQLFFMEDLTLNGIQSAVAYLNEQGKAFDHL